MWCCVSVQRGVSEGHVLKTTTCSSKRATGVSETGRAETLSCKQLQNTQQVENRAAQVQKCSACIQTADRGSAVHCALSLSLSVHYSGGFQLCNPSPAGSEYLASSLSASLQDLLWRRDAHSQVSVYQTQRDGSTAARHQ